MSSSFSSTVPVQLLEMAVEQSSEGVAITNPDGRIIYCNPAFAFMHGYTPQELVGRHLSTFHAPEQMPAVEAALQCIFQQGDFQGELWRARQDGTLFPAWSNCSLVRGQDGEVIGILGTFRDASESHRSTAALKESEARYRTLFETVPLGIGISDLQGNPLEANQAMYEICGYTPEHKPANLREMYVNIEDRQRLFEELKVHGVVHGFETRLKRPDGSLYDASMTLSPFPGGGEGCMLVVFADITRPKQMQAQLRTANQLLETVLDKTHVMLAVLDPEFNFIKVNLTMAFNEGFPPEYFVGKNMVELYPVVKDYVGILQQVLTTGEAISGSYLPFNHPVRKTVYFDWSLVPVKDENGQITTLIATAIDVTGRAKAQVQLHQSEMRLRSVIENMPVMIVAVGENGEIVLWNRECEHITGYFVHEMLHSRVASELLYPDEDYRASLSHLWDTRESPFDKMELRMTAKDGRVHTVQWQSMGGKVQIAGWPRWGIGIDITALKEAQAEFNSLNQDLELRILQRTEQLRTVQQIGLQIGSELNYDKLLESIVAQAMRLVGGSSGTLHLYKPEEGIAERRVYLGRPRSFQLTRVPPGHGIVGRVLQSGKPLIVNNYPEWEGCVLPLDQCPYAALSLPIWRGTRLLGVIAINVDSKRDFVQADVDLLQLLVPFAAMAIENAGLYQRVQDSEQLYRLLVETSPDAIALTDLENKMIMLNPQMVKLLGFENEEELRGRNVLSFMIPQELGRATGNIEEARQKGTIHAVEYTMQRKDGSEFTGEISASVVNGVDGQPGNFIIILRDVTAHKQAYIQIQKHARRAEALAEVAAQINGGLNMDVVLKSVCEQLSQVLNVPNTMVFLLNQERRQFVFRAAIGPMVEELRSAPSVPLDMFEKWVSKETVTYIMDARVQLSSIETDFISLNNIATVAVAPLLRENELFGFLCAMTLVKPQLVEKEDLEMLQAFAHQASIAIANARLFEEVKDSRQRLQVLYHQLAEVQEKERRALASELHDEVGQYLAVLNMRLNTTPDLSAAGREHLQPACTLVEELQDKVQALSLRLRPSILDDLGLLPALAWHFQRYRAQFNIQVHFEHENIERRFPAQVEITVYRIIQEALTNSARHAQVNQVFVSVGYKAGMIHVHVADEGQGFDPNHLTNGGVAVGLTGMQERCRLLGCNLEIKSAPGAGTVILADIPVSSQEQLNEHPNSADR